MTEINDTPLPPEPDSNPDAEPVDPFVFSLPGQAENAREQSLWAAVLLLLVLVAYWPATTGKFIWDDNRYVSANKLLSAPGGLEKIWTGRWTNPAKYPLPQYYPLTHTSFWLEYHLTGSNATGQAAPFSYHVTNIVLHGLSAILLWLILRRLKVPGAWVAAGVFALHPLNVESVAWISERKNVLAGLFFFGSILLYLFADEQDETDALATAPADPGLRWGCYAGALLAFTLAMLSKSTACALPAVMVLLLWWKRRMSLKQWGLLAPFFAIGIVLGLATAQFERTHVGAVGPDWDFSLADRFIIAGRAIWFYVGKMLVPNDLSFSYHQWVLHPEAVVQYLPAALVVAVLLALLLLSRAIGRGPVALATAFCVCLFPALGFFNVYPMRYTFVADHYAYLASAVFATALIGGLSQLIARPLKGPGLPTVLSIILLLTLGSLAWSRTHVMLSKLSVWQDTVNKNPTSWLAQGNLGVALEVRAIQDRDDGDDATAKKDLAEAVKHERRAIALRPKNAEAEWGLARALGEQGKNTQAITHFKRAIADNSKLIDPRKDLASALLSMGRNDQAIAVLDKVLAMQPHSSYTHQLLARAYEAKKDYPRAMAEDRQAIKIKPDNFMVREQLGRLLAQAGKYHDAAVQFAVIVQAKPNRPDIWNVLGMVEDEQGHLGAARKMFQTALQFDPTNVRYQKNLDRTNAAIKKVLARRAATRPTTKPTKPIGH